MPEVHRHNDSRACGATTISSQSTVTAGGQAIATVGDINSHGSGALSENGRTVTIGGKAVVAVNDPALADNLAHTPTQTRPSTGIGTISIG